LWLRWRWHKISQINLFRQSYVEKAKWAISHGLRQQATFAVRNIRLEFFFFSHGLILFSL
jgi:hypothetical protein